MRFYKPTDDAAESAAPILGLYWGYIGIMGKKMETTGIIRITEGLY